MAGRARSGGSRYGPRTAPPIPTGGVLVGSGPAIRHLRIVVDGDTDGNRVDNLRLEVHGISYLEAREVFRNLATFVPQEVQLRREGEGDGQKQ
jgi:hypothetical protein